MNVRTDRSEDELCICLHVLLYHLKYCVVSVSWVQIDDCGSSVQEQSSLCAALSPLGSVVFVLDANAQHVSLL